MTKKLMITPPPTEFLSSLNLFVPRAGECLAGSSWSITSVNDLLKYPDQLECIFHAGIGPDQVPLGAAAGTLLLAANSTIPSYPAPFVYDGDYIYATKCYGSDDMRYFGKLKIGSVGIGVSELTIDKQPMNMAAGEVPYYGDGLLMDFTVSTQKECPMNFAGVGKIRKSLTFDLMGTSMPPISGYVDFGVVVGQDAEDGGYILLNKAMAYNPLNDTFSTILYYAIKTYDTSVTSQNVAEISVDTGFSYERTRLPPPASIPYSVKKTLENIIASIP